MKNEGKTAATYEIGKTLNGFRIMFTASVLALTGFASPVLASPMFATQAEGFEEESGTLQHGEGAQADGFVEPAPKEVVQVPKLFGFGDRAPFGVSGMSARTTEGVTTISESGDGQVFRSAKITFEEEVIHVLVTRHFNREQWNELVDDAPSLMEYAESFPQTADGFDVELTVGLSRMFTADSVEEFAKIYPSIYKRYERMLDRNGRLGRGRFAFGGMPAGGPLGGPRGLAREGFGGPGGPLGGGFGEAMRPDKDAGFMASANAIVKQRKAAIATTENELAKLKLESESLSGKYAPGHPAVLANKQKMNVVQIRLKHLKSELDRLELAIEKMIALEPPADPEQDEDVEDKQ